MFLVSMMFMAWRASLLVYSFAQTDASEAHV